MIESEIENDIGQLLGALHKAGYRVDSTRYDAAAFGNWWVELSGPTNFSLFKDRGQYMVEGPRDDLEKAGLWRAFDDCGEFTKRLLEWAVG